MKDHIEKYINGHRFLKCPSVRAYVRTDDTKCPLCEDLNAVTNKKEKLSFDPEKVTISNFTERDKNNYCKSKKAIRVCEKTITVVNEMFKDEVLFFKRNDKLYIMRKPVTK